ncbi:MAG: adenosylmethionine decarboxylase [Caldilineaceae bacterium]
MNTNAITKSEPMDVLIRHIIIELNKCMFEQLNDPTFLEESLAQMTRIMKTDIKSKSTYQFEPQGVTSLLIIGASHISVHTWPEHAYADIDLVVCTDNFEMDDLIAYLSERFGTEEVRYMEIQRGIFA